MTKKSGDSCVSVLFKMTILVSILVSVLVGGIYFAYNKLNEFFNRGGTVIVPDFRGQHMEEVMRNKPKEIEILRRDEKYDERYLKDHIIAQFPEPGTIVKPGRNVLVSVSLGLQKVNVPDLIGANMREVNLTLMNSQLVIGDRAYVFSDIIRPDRIVGQSPLPSEEYGVNKNVDLLISLGKKPESFPLPNLIGNSLDEGRNKIKTWGLNFGRIFSKKDPSKPKFQIIATNPSPYSQIRKGDVIGILVSSGNDEGISTITDLRRFEIFPQTETKKVADKILPIIAPPQIIVSQRESSIQKHIYQEYVEKPRINTDKKEVSFYMPDGFMPKEVKFIHITAEGRKQIYAGAHKPLELVKVKVPDVPNSIVKIYLNDVPVEDRKIE